MSFSISSWSLLTSVKVLHGFVKMRGCVKAIACQDAHSVAVYKKVVAALGEVYPGAKLEVVDWDKIPSKPRARVWVSAKPAEPVWILHLLQPRTSNSQLEDLIEDPIADLQI